MTVARPVRIVIADDHPLFREGVASSLTIDPAFNVVAQAENGEQAVEMSIRLKPDLVLLDVNMPGTGGVAAAGRIAAALPGVRIVMLTVADAQDSLLAALKVGAHGYLLKGVAAQELRAVVKRIADGESYVTPHLAAQMLMEFLRPVPAAGGLDELTPREAQVLGLLKEGLTNKEIGERIHLAEKTIKHYVTNILQKLQVRSRTEAALLAQRKVGGER